MCVKAFSNRGKKGEQSLSLQFRVSMTPIDKTLTLPEHRHMSRHLEFLNLLFYLIPLRPENNILTGVF